MKHNKYARNRRKFLLINFCFTAVAVLLSLLGNEGFGILTATGSLLFCSPLWIIYFLVVFKIRKQISRSNALCNGDLEKMLENCTDCTEEYALLDKGIFNYSSGRLSLYSDISCLTPRNFNNAHQLWIYENGEVASAVVFDSDAELDGFLEKIRYMYPELMIWEKEGAPSREELDSIIRKELGRKVADRLGIAKMTDGEYAELTEGKEVDDSTGTLVDKDKVIF